jgi:hypothetical protein
MKLLLFTTYCVRDYLLDPSVKVGIRMKNEISQDDSIPERARPIGTER